VSRPGAGAVRQSLCRDRASFVGPEDPRWPRPHSQAVSAVMRANARPDTQPELAVRSALHRRGLRFRKGVRIKLGGRSWTRPDAIFSRARVVLFVDGCFWHSCPVHGTNPRVNSEYWGPKLRANVARDRQTDRKLEDLGWSVVRAWEHEDPEIVAQRVASAITTRTGGSQR
jgi:DNA mismatch endonuclease (patch repair protein)